MQSYIFSLIAVVVGIILIPTLTLAATPIIHSVNLPYESFSINPNLDDRTVYLGLLSGDPHLYEITVGSNQVLTVLLKQPWQEFPVPLSFILVREKEGNLGVSEIGRFGGLDTEWKSGWQSALGASVLVSEPIQYTLAPGVYRFEVSAPNNEGRYLLVLGEGDTSGYVDKWREMTAVQDFFGLSSLRVLVSTLFLYPFGIIVLLSLIYLTWRWQRRK